MPAMITVKMYLINIAGKSCTMFRLFPQSPLHLKHTFGKTLYAGRVKPIAEASELFTHAVSARRRPQNGVFGVRPFEGQKCGCRRVQNGDCRAHEGDANPKCALVRVK